MHVSLAPFGSSRSALSSPRQRRLVKAFGLLLAIALGFLLPATTRVAWAYQPPPLTGHVVDPDGLLDAASRSAVEAKLVAYEKQKGPQIVVLVLASLGGETVEDVAYGAFNTWKLGSREKDDGVLLLIAKGDRVARIETGKGVGGVLPDLQTARILREHVSPHMREGKIDRAVDAGTTAIAQTLSRDPAAAPAPAAKPETWFDRLPMPLKILVVILALILILVLKANGISVGGGGGGSSRGGGFFGGGGSSGGGGSNDRW